ncbi:MAG: aspartate/glutamate racemase family protein [Burkholderiaceae bacterium]|nr:aspartate/glutamate racemase family protein [Burkholderiaceae bacterium]
MSLRIWHQSFTVLSDLGAYDAALKAHFRKVARPGTEIVMHGMRPGTYRTNYPGIDIRHAAIQRLHSIQFIEAGLAAEEEGFDAYAISTLPDPALQEIRSLLGIPVVGYGESAMLSSCLLGARFAVVVFIAELADLIAENARRYGLSDRLAGVSDVGFRFDDVLKGFSEPAPLIERFRTAARAQIARGAEVIIPGEAPLCVLLASQGVSSVDGVPVLDSLSCWVKHAEMLVDLKRQSGVERCQRGYFNEPPPRERIRELFEFYSQSAVTAPGREP